MPDQPDRPLPRCTDPLLAALTRGLEPADSPAYHSGVVVVGRLDRPIRSSVPDRDDYS
jgi:hypothetical protein